MSQYKLKEGEDVRHPVIKRSEINIHVPVLLICFALAALIWLYVVGLSRITSDALTSESETTAVEEPTRDQTVEPETVANSPAEVMLPSPEPRS
ncbi:MAG: hypothetical protein IJD38_04970 [Clostridia bacterium]|nr:hypothetical protein [Clostridia bacterium]